MRWQNKKRPGGEPGRAWGDLAAVRADGEREQGGLFAGEKPVGVGGRAAQGAGVGLPTPTQRGEFDFVHQRGLHSVTIQS